MAMYPPYQRYINKKITEGKKWIEEWYDESSPNYYLTFGIEYDKQSKIDNEQLKKEYKLLDKENEKEYEQFIVDQVAKKHLSKLKKFRSEREEIYSQLEKNDTLLLLEFLDLISAFPDIVHKKRLTRERSDESRISSERDYLESEKRKAAQWYKRTVKNIEKCVDRENEKLFKKYHGNRLQPITVEIHNPYKEIDSLGHRPAQRYIKFIRDLSKLISNKVEKPAERSLFIGSVLKYFYGLPDSAIDPRTIRKHC
jgi:hypothetical protein